MWVVMERLPVIAQLRLVGTSLALAGAHGAGLGLAPFLPAAPLVRRVALLEICPRRMRKQGTSAWYDYWRWAAMSGVRFYRLNRQPDAPECVGKDFRACGNFTVQLPQALEKLREVWACVTHADPRAPWKQPPPLH